jgi:hypothetical protein
MTNAFFSAIIPVIKPTEVEELEALRILRINPNNIRCIYCGDKATEWDHLRAIISDQKPTGYITEIANLVPSCGKCNQSKGKSNWRTWMESNAKLSPKTRGIQDIKDRISRLQNYEAWRQPRKIDFATIVGSEKWQQHTQNWRSVLDLLKKSQDLANEIRDTIVRESASLTSC